MRKFIFVLLAILVIPISVFAGSGDCTGKSFDCNSPCPCQPYISRFCCPHFYVKPSFTLSRTEVNSSVASRSYPGGAISIGFIEPWTSLLSWGVEGGWGYYGSDTFRTINNQTIITTVTTSSGDGTTTFENKPIVSNIVNKYNAFDLAGLIYVDWNRLSFFGKAGFANVYVNSTGKTQVPLGSSTSRTTDSSGTITQITSNTIGFSPVNSRTSDTVPLVGMGVDYHLLQNLATGVEFIHIAGSNILDPIDSLQLYVRLTT